MPRHFKHWLKAYCEYTATSEAPLDFHFWTGVSTIASVLRRRVWRDEDIFKWTPNFYIIFVGPPGVVTKSTTISIGYDLLRNVPGVNFGPDSMTWHGLAKKFEAAFEYHPKGLPPDQQVPMSPLTCSISELGTFLKPADRELISFLTDVWDGKDRPFEHATGYSGQIKIENPWLNVIGATTPEWMRDNFPASMLQQGIGSRIVFIFGDKKRHLSAYPSRVRKARNFDYQLMGKQLTEDLVDMSQMFGAFDLTEEAFLWGEKWHAQHNSSRTIGLASSRYGGYLARKQTHLHKLAMILVAAQRSSLVIEKEDLEAAMQILEGTEKSMIHVFESVGVVEEAKHVAEVVAYVRAYKFITIRDLYKLCYNVMSERDFKGAVRVACDGGLLEIALNGGAQGLAPKKGTIH